MGLLALNYPRTGVLIRRANQPIKNDIMANPPNNRGGKPQQRPNGPRPAGNAARPTNTAPKPKKVDDDGEGEIELEGVGTLVNIMK